MRMIFILIALVTSCSWSVAAQQLDESEMTLLFNQNPPHIFEEETQAVGPFVEYSQAIMQGLGQAHRVKLVPIKRGIAEAELDHGIIMGIVKTPEREAKLDFSEPIHYTRIVFAVAKERPFTFNFGDDLKGKTIGTHFGWSYGMRFDMLRQRKYFETMDGDLSLNIKRLLVGRVDYIIATQASLVDTLQRQGLQDQVIILDNPWEELPIYIAAAKGKHKDFLKAFSDAAAVVSKDRPYSYFLQQAGISLD